MNSGSPKPMDKLKAHGLLFIILIYSKTIIFNFILLKACLMVIAWMFFAFTGILFAR